MAPLITSALRSVATSHTCMWCQRAARDVAPVLGPPHTDLMASYSVNERAIAQARRLIDARQYVLDSDWGEVSAESRGRECVPGRPLLGRLRRMAPRP